MLTLKLTLSTSSGLALSDQMEWDPLGRTDMQVVEDRLDELTTNLLTIQAALNRPKMDKRAQEMKKP